MDSNHSSPVLADPAPINNSRLGIHSSVTSNSYITIPRKKQGKVDDIFSNSWLDAMRSSSPSRKKLIKSYKETAVEHFDAAYLSWMLKHPSALIFFDQIKRQAKNKKVVIFLDYDGTLSPIVSDPDNAFMSNDMRLAVKNVAKLFPTSIITGRSRDKVRQLVGLTELFYAGSHGMDIMCPVKHGSVDNNRHYVGLTNVQEKELKLVQPAREFLPMIEQVIKALVRNTEGIKGTTVENNKFCASVHYRNVEEKDWSSVAQIVHETLKDYPRLQLMHGRKVLEVRPVVDWNKGRAVEFLLHSLDLHDKADVLPIYIGDDRSDEDAFKFLRERKCGIGILVSSVPKETKASYSLKDPPEVTEFLKAIANLKKMEEL
ncbi:hypothetical protein MLD38_036543 [Melastoma candidum]|uniref:Uncharacterized protein n=1 Tax=Melastoma candidum TaxID=119954 RepID=A0ACB9LJJ8_9MYRT|nr:hypothetical protein MLD38_036543 [Melastoma candidum]